MLATARVGHVRLSFPFLLFLMCRLLPLPLTRWPWLATSSVSCFIFCLLLLDLQHMLSLLISIVSSFGTHKLILVERQNLPERSSHFEDPRPYSHSATLEYGVLMVDYAMYHGCLQPDVVLGFCNDYQLWGTSRALTLLQNPHSRINIRLYLSIDRR